MKRIAYTALSVLTLNLGFAFAAIPLFTPAQLLDFPAHYQNYAPTDADELSHEGGFMLNYATWQEGYGDPAVIVHVEAGHPEVWEMILETDTYPIDTIAPAREVLFKVNRPDARAVEVDLVQSGPFAGKYIRRSDIGGYIVNTYVTSEFALGLLKAVNSNDDNAIPSKGSPLYDAPIGAFIQAHDDFCKLQYVTCMPGK